MGVVIVVVSSSYGRPIIVVIATASSLLLLSKVGSRSEARGTGPAGSPTEKAVGPHRTGPSTRPAWEYTRSHHVGPATDAVAGLVPLGPVALLLLPGLGRCRLLGRSGIQAATIVRGIRVDIPIPGRSGIHQQILLLCGCCCHCRGIVVAVGAVATIVVVTASTSTTLGIFATATATTRWSPRIGECPSLTVGIGRTLPIEGGAVAVRVRSIGSALLVHITPRRGSVVVRLHLLLVVEVRRRLVLVVRVGEVRERRSSGELLLLRVARSIGSSSASTGSSSTGCRCSSTSSGPC
mmetsp:Transcript_30293/g.51222  ORF Transcript_30293/g.51222 Transcript_30293/m.51222 type:complete len:294 (+) Transcript_30293:265-1146(+)